MITKTEDFSGIDVIPVLKKIGYDYAELSLSHLCAMSDSEFNELHDKLLEIGLPVEACNNFFPASLKLTGKEVNGDMISVYLQKAFQCAESLGVKVIVFGSGLARMVPEGFPSEKAFSQLADLLKNMNHYARKRGITIAIEPLRSQECNIVNKYSDGIELAEKTNASNIKCLLDYFHLSEERENISVIQKNEKMLAHIHFAEPVGRVFPHVENTRKYEEFFVQLKSAGYDQRISIEAYSADFENDASIALNLLKGIEYELNH
jgi:D-psicose/D-tagatose/L-ribulose 3-epimerase